MSSGWTDEPWNDDVEQRDEDGLGGFYCPYTNTAVCALLAKGWQPQELCRDLECDQLKLFDPKSKHHRHAA